MLHSIFTQFSHRRLLLAVSCLTLSATCANAQQAGGSPASPAPAVPTPAAPAAQTPAPPVPSSPAEVPPAVPAANALTLEQAIAIGMRENPQVTQTIYQVESAHENLNSQRAPINPTVQYAGLNNSVAPADVASGFGQLDNYSAYATIETNGAQHWRTATARNQFHQAQFDSLTTRLALKTSIINAYVTLQAANKALQVEQDVYASTRQVSDLTSQRFQLGASPQADAIRAQVAMVQEQQNLLTDAAAVRSARAALNGQLGQPADAPVDAVETLAYKPVTLPDIAELQRRATQNRPEIKSADANTESLKSTTHLEQSQYYPDVLVGRGLNSGPVEVGISVPIDLGSIRGQVKKARADAKAQEAAAEIQRQGVLLDVQNSYINVVSAQAQVDSYESGILKQSEQLLSQTRQGYALGASTILDLITAENTYRSTITSYYAAVGSYSQAIYQLEHAIGAPLDAAPGASLTATTASVTGVGTQVAIKD